MDRAPVRADLRQVGDYARRGGGNASGFRGGAGSGRVGSGGERFLRRRAVGPWFAGILPGFAYS